ncbi:MAG TPA: hypothetical protein VF381_04050 [Thermoanaerobaculia bacterium]
MKKLLGIGVLVLLAGCAGNMASVDTGGGITFAAAGDTQSDTTNDFEVAVEQANMPMSMPTSANDRTPVAPLDIKYAISITNLTKEAVTVRHITLSSPEGPFVIRTTMRNYKKTIGPGATEKVEFWAQAQAADANVGAATPALVRTMIEFEGPQGKRTESFMRDVNGRFGAGIG